MIELFSKDGLICTVDGECQVQVRNDENRDSPEQDMVNPSTDSYMWPIQDTH